MVGKIVGKMVGKREKRSGWQVKALLLAEGVSQLLVVFSILEEGTWNRYGSFAAACLAGCLVTVPVAGSMWAEDAFYHTVLYAYGRTAAFTMYAAAFWLFLSQIPVMLRLLAEVMLQELGFLDEGGGSFPGTVLLFLPFLISSAVNALFYLRKVFLRLYQEGAVCCRALRQPWIRNMRDFFWWALVAFACVLAAGFRDRYSAAGFYCAYNWLILPSFFVLLTAACLCRKFHKRSGHNTV